MRVARASLRDRKQVDHQGFKFLAHVGDGPDESGVQGYTGGPALDAGRSCVTVTPGKRSEGYILGGSAGACQWAARAALPGDTQGEITVSMVLARGAGGRTSQRSGVLGYVSRGGPALDAGRSCVTLGVMGPRICRSGRARGGAGSSESCATPGL